MRQMEEKNGLNWRKNGQNAWEDAAISKRRKENGPKLKKTDGGNWRKITVKLEESGMSKFRHFLLVPLYYLNEFFCNKTL